MYGRRRRGVRRGPGARRRGGYGLICKYMYNKIIFFTTLSKLPRARGGRLSDSAENLF